MNKELLEALLKRCPLMKPNMAKRCVDKYVTHVMQEIAAQYCLMSKDDLLMGEMSFALDEVTEACGRALVGGKYIYRVRLMHEHASTSLVAPKYKGNSISKRLSRITFSPKYKKKILEQLINLTIELNPSHLRKLDLKSNHSADIDIESLASYIEATRDSLQRAPSEAYEEKLIRNLQIANQLLASAKIDDEGGAYVDEYWEQIDSGRINGFGISLQRIPKEVRHAALGHCHRYDFKAASYALITSLALSIEPTLKVAALKDYIKHRSVMRKRIAEDVGVSEDWIKRVFTAVGFGAELADNPYASTRKLLGKDKHAKLLANEEFMQIKLQLDQVNKVINKHYSSAGFTLCGRTYNPINPKNGRKRTKNQKLAWIYQCMESHALGLFVELIPSDYEVMLLVHDCIYLDKRLSAQRIADIKWKLSEVYPLLNFEHEETIPIHASKDHGKRERAMLLEEPAHKERMAEQQKTAMTWRPVPDSIVSVAPVFSTAPLAETKAEYDAKRKAQFLLDVAEAERQDGDEQQESYFKDPY